MKRVAGLVVLCIAIAVPEIITTVSTFVRDGKPARARDDVAGIVPSAVRQDPRQQASRKRAPRRSSPQELPPAYLAHPLLFLSRAREDSLTCLPGVGPVLAARIVDARSTRGPFTAWGDLLTIRGIGPRTLEKLKARSRR